MLCKMDMFKRTVSKRKELRYHEMCFVRENDGDSKGYRRHLCLLRDEGKSSKGCLLRFLWVREGRKGDGVLSEPSGREAMNNISQLSSAIVFCMVCLVFGSGVLWIWDNVPIVMAVAGSVILVSTVSFIAFMYVSKGHAMWVGDAKAKHRPRVTRSKS